MASNSLETRKKELEVLFNRAPIKTALGMNIRFDKDHRAIFELPYNSHFDHSMGGIHGGVISTLLDNAGWFTVAANHNNWIATVEFQVRLLEPVAKKDLWSIGKIVRAGKRISVAEMEVRTGDDILVAVGSGTFTVTSVPFALSPQ